MDAAAVEEKPGRRRASALAPDERRSMIVEAAVPLLLEHGEMVTTRQIADAAGIAEGTIFRVFPDKDALLQAVLDWALDPAPLDEAIAAIDPTLDFEATLRAMVSLVQKRSLDLWRILSSVGARFAPERKGFAVSPPMVAYLRANADRLRTPPAEAARLLRALSVSLTHPSLIEDPMSARRIVDLFLHGAGAASC